MEPNKEIKIEGVGTWSFDDSVSRIFDDHILSSVPFYKEAHDLIVKTSDYFLANGDKFIELGCSTGRLTQSIAKRHLKKSIKFIGIDNQKSMIDMAINNNKDERVEFLLENILESNFKSTFIVSAFTIQFIRPKSRQFLINKIYGEMEWGGGFCFFEKVRGSDARFQDILNSIHWEWKIENGHTEEDIIKKWRSLKRVMEPFSDFGNQDMLKRAGFKDIETIWKWGPFQGYLAIK